MQQNTIHALTLTIIVYVSACIVSSVLQAETILLTQLYFFHEA